MEALPAWALLASTIIVFAGFGVGGQLALHRALPHTRFVEHNEVAGFIISVAGTMYAVVLGFLTVVVWQQYDGTRERLADETSAAGNAWHMAVGFPADVRHRIRSDIQRYAHVMDTEEWPLMRRGSFSGQGDTIIMNAVEAAGTFDARGASPSNAQNLTLQQLGALHDARSRRLSANAHGLAAFEWAILVTGAVVVIAVCWLFGMENPSVHLVLTGSVAVVIALMFSILIAMQYPFRGQMAIDSTPWVALERHMDAMDRSASAAMQM